MKDLDKKKKTEESETPAEEAKEAKMDEAFKGLTGGDAEKNKGGINKGANAAKAKQAAATFAQVQAEARWSARHIDLNQINEGLDNDEKIGVNSEEALAQKTA